MNTTTITNRLRQIVDISGIANVAINDVGLGEAMFRLGRINGLASVLLDCMSETDEPDTTVTVAPVAPPRTKSGKMPYIRSRDIIEYIWCHDGSVRMEYLLRDLYYDRKGAERLATTTLVRMEMLAMVHLDRDDDRRISVIAALKMPKD